ncbi:hypothetical protein [Gracilimonas sp. BCB1]|uniref:hypothetical protein n=1 Tax=Gracilimonas sp. BCB1 TaxID=3152362 RepID=UPI003F841F79
MIISLCNQFGEDCIQVMFHHSIDPDYLKTPNPRVKLYNKNLEFANWLSENNITYKDISGSADDLMEEYNQANLHIGYRVHAHILCQAYQNQTS